MANKTARLWFVIPNGLAGDGRQWWGPDNAPQVAERLEPARANRRNDPPADLDAPADTGYGLYLASKETKEILAFTTKEKAQQYAKYQAGLNPSKLYGIYSCEQVFETTEPTIIEKKFNDAGELVLVGV
jgi:hypothetical protein